MLTRRLLLTALLLLALPAAALAQAPVGTVVGKECLLKWSAPTVNTDGTPITAPLGFKRYDQTTPTPGPVPGTTVPVSNFPPPVTGNAATQEPCGTANAGQHYSWETAYYATGAESPVAPAPTPWYLTLAPPNVPTTVKVAISGTACTITWAAPTTNTDGTALIGSMNTPTTAPLTWLVYVAPGASPPVPGTTTPTLTLSPPATGGNAPASFACSQVPTGGQQNIWIAAQNANGLSGVQPSPLAFGAVPTTPSGLTVN